MRGLARFLYAVLVVFAIVSALLLVMVVFPPVKSVTCQILGNELPNFCQGGKYVPPNVEVIWQKISAVNPQVLVAQWHGQICANGSTSVPITKVDTSDLGKTLSTGLQWLGDSLHNGLRAEDFKLCNEFSVPVYIELAKVDVREGISGKFEIWLPPPTIGDPAAVGQWQVTADPKLFSEKGIRQEQVIQNNLEAMTHEARKQASASVETRNEALCKGFQQFVSVLASLQGVQYEVRWAGEFIRCGG